MYKKNSDSDILGWIVFSLLLVGIIGSITTAMYFISDSVDNAQAAWKKFKVEHHCTLKSSNPLTVTYHCDDGADYTRLALQDE